MLAGRIAGLLGLGGILFPPSDVLAQSEGVVLYFGAGLNAPGAGTRFDNTSPGYLVEASLGVPLSSSWHIGAGAEWGTFDAEVPQFAAFAPLDHAPWLEYSMLYGRVRYLLGANPTSVRPFAEGRLGWLSERAEYSGAWVRRSGLATGASAGLAWEATSRVGAHLTGTLVLAALGEATLDGFSGAAASSVAHYGKLTAGFAVRIGG